MDKCIVHLNVDQVKELNAQLSSEGIEKDQLRFNLEKALRYRALTIAHSNCTVADVANFVEFVISLAREEMCSRSIVIQLLQDIFDINLMKRCEELFVVVENNIDVFKTEFFFEYCKNAILRMCNDLLKRLSRTINMAFCGRILVLLAKSLPLNEKSGLNLAGQFNTANVTVYEEENQLHNESSGEDDDEERDEGELREKKDSGITVDYALYVKFWETQTFFANPNMLYDSAHFQKFESNLNDICDIFATYKLERPSSQKDDSSATPSQTNNTVTNKLEENNEMDVQTSAAPTTLRSNDDDDFFAKYLTSQKLFNLQLADSQFRRYFLVQCLIVANYLSTKAKIKESMPLLSAPEEAFVRELTDRCHSLLRETYPHGAHFAESVRRILNREKLWAGWKSDGCPDLVSPLLKIQCRAYKKRPVENYNSERIDLSNKELTRLWNINPNNLESCTDGGRNCTPQLHKFIDDGLDELDPEQEVEEQYKSVNDEKYQWLASRFLLSNSDQYMNCVNLDMRAPHKPTAKFLEQAIHLTAMFIPDLKAKAERIQENIQKQRLAEEQAQARLAEEQELKLRQKAEARLEARRKTAEEERGKLEELKAQKVEEMKEAAVTPANNISSTTTASASPAAQNVSTDDKEKLKRVKKRHSTDLDVSVVSGPPTSKRERIETAAASSEKQQLPRDKQIKEEPLLEKEKKSSNHHATTITVKEELRAPVSERREERVLASTAATAPTNESARTSERERGQHQERGHHREERNNALDRASSQGTPKEDRDRPHKLKHQKSPPPPQPESRSSSSKLLKKNSGNSSSGRTSRKLKK